MYWIEVFTQVSSQFARSMKTTTVDNEFSSSGDDGMGMETIPTFPGQKLKPIYNNSSTWLK